MSTKDKRQELIQQVDDYLIQQSKSTKMQTEMDTFFNLLGRVQFDSHNKGQLSVILSQESMNSSMQSTIPYQPVYLDTFAKNMQTFLTSLKEEPTIQLDRIYNYYMKQLLEIDKLIQYVYDMRYDQRINVDDTQTKLLEITKQQLNDSNQLNQRLLVELRDKTQENQRRNVKFNEILQQIKQLESQVKQYQMQMNDITTQLMNIRQNLNEAIDGQLRSATPIKSVDRSNLNSFRNHFNTTPPKKSRDDEQIKSTSYKKETPKQKKEQIEKIYKQLFRKYY